MKSVFGEVLFIVATRDTPPYDAAGVTVINPWEAHLRDGLT